MVQFKKIILFLVSIIFTSNSDNELSQSVNTWTTVSGTWQYDTTDIHFTQIFDDGEAEMEILDKQWYNLDGCVSIDYTFSVTFGAHPAGTTGLILFNGQIASYCEWYYIYIDQDAIGISRGNVPNHKETGLTEVPLLFTYIDGTDHTLSVRVCHDSTFTVSMDGISHISSITDTKSNAYRTLKNGYSGYIGIYSESKLITTAKSLLISGARITVTPFVASSNNCVSLHPTNHPSTSPTPAPSEAPTQPTADPSPAPSPSPSAAPTPGPTLGTNDPSIAPTDHPTKRTKDPTTAPTVNPSSSPTDASPSPSSHPSPSATESTAAVVVSHFPTNDPTKAPTDLTSNPSTSPTADKRFTSEASDGANSNDVTSYAQQQTFVFVIIFGSVCAGGMSAVICLGLWCLKTKKEAIRLKRAASEKQANSAPKQINAKKEPYSSSNTNVVNIVHNTSAVHLAHIATQQRVQEILPQENEGDHDSDDDVVQGMDGVTAGGASMHPEDSESDIVKGITLGGDDD